MAKNRAETEGRIYSWTETSMMEIKRVITDELLALFRMGDYRLLLQDLNDRIHGENGYDWMTYEEVIRWYFFESERTLAQLSQEPFIMALQNAVAKVGFQDQESWDGDLADWDGFSMFVEPKISWLVDSFGKFITESGLIRGLSPQQIERRRVARAAAWRQEHPEEFQANQLKAARKSAQYGAYVYTDELRQQIQLLFDEGATYDEVIELLSEFGISATQDSLKSLVYFYDDLVYTPPIRAKEEYWRFKQDLKTFFLENGRNKKKTIEHFEALGFSQSKINATLFRMNLKSETD